MLIFFLSGRPLLQLYMRPDESMTESCGLAERNAATKWDKSQTLLASGAATINGVVQAVWEQTAPDLGTVMTEITQSEQKTAESPDFVSTPTSTGRLIGLREVVIWNHQIVPERRVGIG
jgi:hypothetical protein